MKAMMKYQLVLQFRADTLTDFDQLVALEDSLIEALAKVADVDGHDMGSGEANIFILTDDPARAFRLAKSLIDTTRPAQELKSGYRDLEKDDFVPLWPLELTDFTVI